MRIDIVGGGAIGLLHAAMLAQVHPNTTVWTRTQSQAAWLRSEGIKLIDQIGMAQNVSIDSHSLEESCELHNSGRVTPHWVILTVKQSHIDDALMDGLARLLTKESSLLCLQNGIGHLEKLEGRLHTPNLYAGVTSIGARRLEVGTVQCTGRGELWFGPAHQIHNSEKPSNLDQKKDCVQKMLINVLELAGFSAFMSNQMKDRIYQKLLVNAVINPLTAIFDVTNGELPKNPARRRLMRALYEETVSILAADGMKEAEEGWERILQVCESTSLNISSMLSDVRAERVTEIDWINGGVASIARRKEIPSLLNDSVSAIVQRLARE